MGVIIVNLWDQVITLFTWNDKKPESSRCLKDWLYNSDEYAAMCIHNANSDNKKR